MLTTGREQGEGRRPDLALQGNGKGGFLRLHGGQAGSAEYPHECLETAASCRQHEAVPLTPDHCPGFELADRQDERKRKVRDIKPRVAEEMDPRVWRGLESSEGRKELVSQEKTKGQSD